MNAAIPIVSLLYRKAGYPFLQVLSFSHPPLVCFGIKNYFGGRNHTWWCSGIIPGGVWGPGIEPGSVTSKARALSTVLLVSLNCSVHRIGGIFIIIACCVHN